MKLLDLDVALEQGHRSCLDLLRQYLAHGVLPVEQLGKRQQRPDEVGRLDHAGRARHGLRDLIRKRAPAFRERSAQVDRCRRRYRCRLRYRCRRWCRLCGRCWRLRCWLRYRSRLLFDGLASGPAAVQQDAERDNDQASRALRPSPSIPMHDRVSGWRNRCAAMRRVLPARTKCLCNQGRRSALSTVANNSYWQK